MGFSTSYVGTPCRTPWPPTVLSCPSVVPQVRSSARQSPYAWRASGAVRLVCEGIAVFAAEAPKLMIGESQELGSVFLMIARVAERLAQKPDLESLHSGEKRLRAAGIDRSRLRLRCLRL